MSDQRHEHADTTPAKVVPTKPFKGAAEGPADPDKTPPSAPVAAKDTHKHKGKDKPKTFSECCSDLSADLDAAVSARDPEAIEDCWDRMDELGGNLGDKSTSLDHSHYRALAVRFAQYAPRKADAVKAIEINLDAGLSKKDIARKLKVEHPAVTHAKAALVELHKKHATHVELPSDAEAVAALEAKIAAVPLEDED